jgi:transcriptional regulator with XRE-family HTH domain
MSNRKGKSLDTDQQIYEKIGKRIKELRLKSGYTAADKFAYENEIGRSQYAAWENGQDMKVSSILKIVKAHRITLNDFFSGIK